MEDYPNNPNYKIIENLGKGHFGNVYKVLNKDNNNHYIIKRFLLESTNEADLKEIQNDIKILSTINNELILKYCDTFSDNKSFNIVTEYCDGLNLRKYINEHKKANKLIEKDIIYHIISEICKGLKDIHIKKLIHRDLKPDNLFLTGDFKIKIGDTGIARQLFNVSEYAKTQSGFRLYNAPEVLYGEKYNNKVDIWSLGCIIYELCTLNYCFESDKFGSLVTKIIQSTHEKIDEKIYGTDLQKLIKTVQL